MLGGSKVRKFIGYRGSVKAGCKTDAGGNPDPTWKYLTNLRVVNEEYSSGNDEWGAQFIGLRQTMRRGGVGVGMGWGDMGNKTLNLAASMCDRQIGFTPNVSVYRKVAEILLADIQEDVWVISRERMWEVLYEITGIKEGTHAPQVSRFGDDF
jgi:hypothetical protein